MLMYETVIITDAVMQFLLRLQGYIVFHIGAEMV